MNEIAQLRLYPEAKRGWPSLRPMQLAAAHAFSISTYEKANELAIDEQNLSFPTISTPRWKLRSSLAHMAKNLPAA